MLRSRFLWKLFAGMVVLVAFMTLAQMAIGIWSLEREARRLEQEQLERLGQTAHRVLHGSGTAISASQRAELAAMASTWRVVFELVEPSGRVALRVPPDVVVERRGRWIEVEGEAEALSLRLASIDESAPRPGLLLSWTLLAALGALGLALWLARRVTRPIRSVARAAEALGGGAPMSRIEVRSRDEIGALAGAFNEARERIATQLSTTIRDRNQLTAVLGSMSEGVIAVDENERVLHVNAVALQLLGVRDPDTLWEGRPILELTRDPHVLMALTDTLEYAVTHRSTYTRGEGAAERVIELTASSLLTAEAEDADSPVAGAVVVLHDITRLQRLEGLRRDFVSNVSHELKTPLTAIRGYVETMLDAGDLDEATRTHFLTRIREQTTRLSQLVSDLLSLSRIESSREGDQKLAVMDARMAVVETVQALRPTIEHNMTQIELDLAEEPVPVRAESESLRQAFSNLIENAVKYSESESKVRVSLKPENDDALFIVEDEGPGISGEHLERIFERFYRVDKGRSREVGGTGLGLAIVKNVANALDGSVQVHSERGVGTRFEVRLPLAHPERPVRTDAAGEGSEEARP